VAARGRLRARVPRPPRLQVERARSDRGEHGALGLVGVGAVVKAAVVDVDRDVVEHVVDHTDVGVDPDLTQSRGVDDPTARPVGIRDHVQRARRGGVATLGVTPSHRARRGDLASGQRVDEGGLARPGLAHERHRPVGHRGPHGVEPAVGGDRGDDRRDPGCRPGDGGHRGARGGGVDQVGLGQHDERDGPGGAHLHDEALDPPRLDRAVEPPDDPDAVDVGGHDLATTARRVAALEQRGAGEHRDHRLGVDQDPVADGERGQGRAQRSGRGPVGAGDDHGDAVVADHPGRRGPRGGRGGRGGGPGLGPAQGPQALGLRRRRPGRAHPTRGRLTRPPRPGADPAARTSGSSPTACGAARPRPEAPRGTSGGPGRRR